MPIAAVPLLPGRRRFRLWGLVDGKIRFHDRTNPARAPKSDILSGVAPYGRAMTYDLLYGLAIFAFVSSVTPGPNNIMLMASGANFGLRRTVPHMFGISLGHAFMVTLVGLGLGSVFTAYPTARLALQILSSAYLLWLAWKVATAAPPRGGEAQGRPFTFLQAAAFQWVNPKAWYMAIYAVTNFMGSGGGVAPPLVVAVVFASVNLPSVTIWASLGTQVRRLLTRPRLLRMFNVAMAILLVLTLVPVWTG